MTISKNYFEKLIFLVYFKHKLIIFIIMGLDIIESYMSDEPLIQM